MEKKKMWEKVEEMKEEMVEMQKELCARPAISPESGEEGEYEKAEYLKKKLQEIGLLVEEYDAKDDRAKNGIRPNIVAKLKGRDSKKSVWILTHMDVVPPGDLKLWKTDPFKAVVKDGKIYGRGTTDNQQDMVASIFAVKALKDLEITPPCDIGLSFVADEETGSRYGLSHLLSAYKGFKERDMILVPDFPSPDGSLIEVAEKSIMWLKSVVEGKQSHASMPQKGINANRIACELTCALDESLHQNYSIKDGIFDPPSSTFEPTKREANVPNINTVPGEDISYWDCRVLPEYDINEIFKEIEGAAKSIERKNNARISIEKVVFDQAAPHSCNGSGCCCSQRRC
jgi:succinyl-diaminopimelate desuccinylase